MEIDYKEILCRAEIYKPAMSQFLREMIAIPAESGHEEKRINRIKKEMEEIGFDRIEIDPMGNILGYIGHGKHLIAMDAHIDNVGVGDRALWEYDPLSGYEDNEIIIGRGASDQLGGMASLVYGAKIIRDLKLEGDYTLLVTGTVQEEDCDGLCWQYIIGESKIRPELVILTEPTSCRIHLGQRGRMEIKLSTRGLSCHGSAPERGDNAIYKMAPILIELRALNENLGEHYFLGNGSLTVSEIFFSSPSRCAVADGCSISIDRRLTIGETAEIAIRQVKNLPAVSEAGAEVEMYDYSQPSYTGLVYPMDSYFPAWMIEESHPAVLTLVDTFNGLFGQEPQLDKWTFSTNGVSIMGQFGIPCVGFGPGHEDQAHAPNEKTWKNEMVKAAAMYALIPTLYSRKYAGLTEL
ncbi:MAG: YgeY family selenium metabolism-linked hydrolase [Bacillota bacterium]|nr:YgeY family selenium metabolism-linked hydrolase [Bacillota bacterium]